MGLYSIIAPEAGTNLVLNPSAEQPGNFANHNGATVTQSLTHARYGAQCYSIVTGATNRGINLTLQALANAIHYVTFYARRDSVAFGGNLEVSLNGGTNYNTATIISGALADSGSRWVRFGVQISAAQANGSTALIIRNTANETFYVDAAQVEQNTVPTTYIDGDRTGLYRWNGLRAGSTSTRDAQERGGGRERDLQTDYGIVVDPATQNYGYPETTLNFFPQPLQPGSLFQSDKLGMRELILQLTFGVTTGPAVTYQSMLQQRKSLLALVRGAQYRGRQPFILRSTAANANKPLYAPFRYKDGMRGGPQKGFSEETPVHVVGEQPFWFEDDNQVVSIGLQQSLASSNDVARRINGAWQNMGTGFDSSSYASAVAVDRVRGRIFFGGNFITANGVTVNRVCYWNGSTFVALGSGTVGVSGGEVFSLAVAPNGDLWVGGAFTAAGGTTTHGLARWNNAANTWTVFALAVSSTFLALAFDSNGLLYAGGGFLNWNGIANADYIVTYDGTTWAALSTGMNASVRSIAIDRNNAAYIGGDFTTSGGVTTNYITRWANGSFSALGVGFSGGTPSVTEIAIGPNGVVYAGGSFLNSGSTVLNRIAAWNGSAWQPLGSGLDNSVLSMAISSDGLLYVGGQFSTAGGIALADRFAAWNGAAWFQVDIDLPVSGAVYGIAFWQSDLFISFSQPGTALTSVQTTITNVGTTETYPVFYLIGPSTGFMTLAWLENQSTGDRLYFNLTVQAGETIAIDLRPNRRQIVSDWRGAINSQPIAGSDFSSFELLPGANVIAAFALDTVTGASLRMHYQPVHDSIDGVA